MKTATEFPATSNYLKPAEVSSTVNNKIKCLFLFTELAGYVVACLKHLASSGNFEVHVVRWPVNKVAPFRLSLTGENIYFHERRDFSNNELLAFADKINPAVIFCSGWIDKGYNAVCKKYFGKVPTVMGLDNPWRNTFRQNIATLMGPLYLTRIFSHCWVPGTPQRIYARKLGFGDKNIREGIYSCDFDLFHSQYMTNLDEKRKSFPKKFIFVGRYTRLKGATELWEAFIRFQLKSPNEWELWCLGKGDLDDKFPVHEKIKNFGFVQPDDMHNFIRDCGVFILPSHYEHWGVVVHEFAAAGFPLICTSTTGAAEAFLKDDHNGYAIPPYSVDSIVNAFIKITSLPDSTLFEMGTKSNSLAKAITPATWSKTFIDFIES